MCDTFVVAVIIEIDDDLTFRGSLLWINRCGDLNLKTHKEMNNLLLAWIAVVCATFALYLLFYLYMNIYIFIYIFFMYICT